MYEIETCIEIESIPDEVWSILVDFAAYPEWNPFIRSIEGAAKKGARLSISIQPVDGKAMSFRPTVLEASPNKELRWLGRFLLPGIFDGEHYLKFSKSHPNECGLFKVKSSPGFWFHLPRRASMVEPKPVLLQ